MACNCKNKAAEPNVMVYLTNAPKSGDLKEVLISVMKYRDTQAEIIADMYKTSGKVMIYEGPSSKAANIIRAMAGKGATCTAKNKNGR